jgi:hypothetical protein
VTIARRSLLHGNDVGGGKLVASAVDADGNLIGLIQLA